MSRRARIGSAAAVAVLMLLIVVTLVAVGRGSDEVETVATADPTSTTADRPSTTAAAGSTSSTVVDVPTTIETPPETEPPTTVAVPATTAAPAPAPAPSAVPAPDRRPTPVPAPQAAAGPIPYFPPSGIEAYRGLGVWLDVLDWSPSYTGGRVAVTPAAVDRMADVGVQTIYIQTSRFNRPEDILDPAVLRAFIDRAHARGVWVVAWYMPTHEDHETDVRRLIAASQLPVDGISVNIESQNQPDIAVRNARVLDLSSRLRAATGLSMSAVVVPPVVTEILNPSYWPDLPWAQLAAIYDVWMPMAYWSNRAPESGWRDGYRYIAENTRLIRTLTGRPDAAVHPVGGIADEITVEEVDGMAQALVDTGAIGGSLYDYVTTRDPLWGSLQAFRRA